jgi:hypothetical protein
MYLLTVYPPDLVGALEVAVGIRTLTLIITLTLNLSNRWSAWTNPK